MKLLRRMRQWFNLPQQIGESHLSVWRALEALERSLDRRSLEPPPFVQVMIVGTAPVNLEPWRAVDALRVEKTPAYTQVVATAGRLLSDSLTLELQTERPMIAGAWVAVIADPSVVRVEVVAHRATIVGRDSFVSLLPDGFHPGEVVRVTVRRRHE